MLKFFLNIIPNQKFALFFKNHKIAQLIVQISPKISTQRKNLLKYFQIEQCYLYPNKF